MWISQVARGPEALDEVANLKLIKCGWLFWRWSGQIITTSAEVTLNGGLIRELPQNPLNSGLGIILICPEMMFLSTWAHQSVGRCFESWSWGGFWANLLVPRSCFWERKGWNNYMCMCQGQNSHWFPMVGDGHLPNSRGYIAIKL